MSEAGKSEGVDFQVRRDDWKQIRFVPAPAPEPRSGEVLFRIDRFALTSNNITYALAGDMIGYWRFFPAEEGWGRLPVMGFADVIASAHSDVPVGQRVFGFFPMSTHLSIQADRVGANNFLDAAPHRADTPLVYRQYTRVEHDPFYAAEHEDRLLLLRGLFMTSFLVDDFLADNDFFGARSFLVSSASSKTSIALAFQLAARSHGEVIGLTSSRNQSFVSGLGCYDRVVPYEEIGSLPNDVPVAFVDMAGNADVVSKLHHHFADNLKYNCVVGVTHWNRTGDTGNLPGAQPTFFFAPTQIEKRTADWGAAGFQKKVVGAWRGFRSFSEKWLRVVRDGGQPAVERVYREMLEGRAAPSEGHVLSLWEP